MNREQLRNLAYRRGGQLCVDNSDYVKLVNMFTVEALIQDLGKSGDITTQSVLRKNNVRRAHIISKQSGIIAGIEEAVWFYNKYDIRAEQIKKDGDFVKPKDIILKLQGKEFDLLKTERVGLNILGRMSGIATLTNDLVKKCAPLLVAATRKTHWGNLDNKAVYIGGGGTHRLGLWESILIKENHLRALRSEGVSDPILQALQRAWEKRNKAVFIEIEVENVNDAIAAAQCFVSLIKKHNTVMPCIIMLDNFMLSHIKKTISLLKQKNYYNRILVEASGSITPKNILQYRNIGVDVVSLGYLTHSPKAFDISQLIIR